MKKVGKRGAIVLFAVIAAVFFVLMSSHAEASDDHLVINEIYPSPTKDLGDLNEWVELFNPTNFAVDLKEYSLKDGANLAKKISISNSLLPPQEYFIFENSTGWLNGDSEGEILFLLEGDAIIDKVAYGDWDTRVLANNTDIDSSDNAATPSSGQSISRIPNGMDTGNDKDDFQIVPVSKGKKNVLPGPNFYSKEIIINEILPEPSTTSNDEFIELYNFGLTDIDLADWRLADAKGTAFVVPFNSIIAGKEYLTLCKNSLSSYCDISNTNISLNDTGDSISLIDPAGIIKYTIKYDKAKRGQSYSKFSDEWKWTLSQTPSIENIFLGEVVDQDDEEYISENIANARQKKNEEIVEIGGVVTVLPGTLSSQYFYIQDETSGIQVYSSKKDFPTLRLGDRVSVIGEMAESNGERRVKTQSSADIQIISSLTPLAPENIVIDQISEAFEGKYIKVKGTVTKTSGNTFYIHGSGEVQVIIRESADITKPKMRKGDTVEIAGVVSEYKGRFRILPTKQSDVIVLSSGALPKAGPEMFSVKYLTVIMVVWSLFLIQKKKLGSSPRSIQKI